MKVDTFPPNLDLMISSTANVLTSTNHVASFPKIHIVLLKVAFKIHLTQETEGARGPSA